MLYVRFWTKIAVQNRSRWVNEAVRDPRQEQCQCTLLAKGVRVPRPNYREKSLHIEHLKRFRVFSASVNIETIALGWVFLHLAIPKFRPKPMGRNFFSQEPPKAIASCHTETRYRQTHREFAFPIQHF